MQESFDIISSSGTYNVAVGSGLLEQVITDYPEALFIVDERLVNYLPKFLTKVILIKATEDNKSLEKMPDVLMKMREAGVNRTSHLVAIGGGVIQDIVTFSASIYMRGITWTYMPTTLLGMADSCVGGKSSINMLGYKNLVGNFYPPQRVLVDINFIKTLNADQVVGGLFEAAKICYARGYDSFLSYLDEQPGHSISKDVAQNVIVKALKTKKWFIETDEFDKKERLLLNFGHTFGHAIEAGTDFGISHGVAVGIGMIIAVEYAKNSSLLSAAGLSKSDHLIEHVKSLVGASLVNVMSDPPKIDISLVMEKFDNDKKHLSQSYRIVVPSNDGTLELISVPKDEHTRSMLRAAYISGLQKITYPKFSQ